MDCQSVPIVIWTGTDWSIVFNFMDTDGNPISLVGYTAQMQIRATPPSTNPAIITIATSNGSITINELGGVITCNIGNAITSQLTNITPFSGVWDLFIYSQDGICTRLAGGIANIYESVTR